MAVARTYTAAPRSGALLEDPALRAWLRAFDVDPVGEWAACQRGDWMLYVAEVRGAGLGDLHRCADEIADLALEVYGLERWRFDVGGDHWEAHRVHAYADAIHARAHAHHLLSHPMSYGAALAADHAIAAALLASPEGRVEGAEKMARRTAEIVRKLWSSVPGGV